MKKKSVGIYELLGIAIGCIGMSHDDFCKCTFGEFESICKAWREMVEEQYRNDWERARTMAAIIIRPHLRKGTRLSPQQLLAFPWDEKPQPRNVPSSHLSAEERKRRFERAAGR